MPRLHFYEQSQLLFSHQLSASRTLIGRSDRCDIALPSESVSRVHCWFERRADGVWLCDRSKNGTRVNGQPIGLHHLSDADEVRIGAYVVRLSSDDSNERESAITKSPIPPAIHEELVEVSAAGVAASHAELTVTRGPREGECFVLRQARGNIGGPGADFVLDPALPPDALRMRVVRSRVMVEPGAASVTLAGSRVREITPAFPGEEIRVGAHALVVTIRTTDERDAERTFFGEMVGASPAMRALFGVLARVAAHDEAVLFTAESGCGKELAARAVHTCGPRHAGPFVAVNCAAIADSLFESELFGHEKGSFTGATQRQNGAFQQAEGGTLFLDEIGEMRLDAQAKLLRALESGEVRRVGAHDVEYPDVRIIAATNRNLSTMAQDGHFRRDLYFRLSVLSIRLPPLRERVEDIGLLARALLTRHHPGSVLSEDALRSLSEYAWPGNVRELRNVLTRAVVLSGPVIQASALQFNPWSFEEEPVLAFETPVDDQAIVDAVRRTGGNRSKAARELGIPRSSLIYKLRRLGLD